MDALRRSLAGKGGGSKERAERFLERKNGKAVAKAALKTMKLAVSCAQSGPLEQEGSETRADGEADKKHFDGKTAN